MATVGLAGAGGLAGLGHLWREAERRAAAETRRSAEVELDHALEVCERGDVGRGVAALAEAVGRLPPDHPLGWTARVNLRAWQTHLVPLRRVLPHPAGVTAVAAAGDRVAAVCDDGAVRLWDVAGAGGFRPPPAFGTAVTAVAFAPDGATLLAAGRDGAARLWGTTGAERSTRGARRRRGWAGGPAAGRRGEPPTAVPRLRREHLLGQQRPGQPVRAQRITFQNFSTGNLTASNSSTTTNSPQLGGANPTVTQTGPTSVSFATGAAGLSLNPSAGTNTVQGAGNGIVTLGSSLAGVTVSGSGGLTLVTTGLGGVSLFGPTAGNTFTGGVTLARGGLTLNGTTSLGNNTVTVNGGLVRGGVSAVLPNSVVLNSTLFFNEGTATLNGPLGGAGGVALASGNVRTPALTLGGANTFTAAVTVQNSQARPNGDPPTNLPTLTLSATGSLATTQMITVGNNGTLVLAGNVASNRVPDAAPLLLTGGRVAVSTTGAGFAETLGTITASGLSVFTLTATGSG